ncbi:hypothetical protein [Mycobacterium sp.]|uniref:hypothetical protein n=1 Tax=Mycobacterium sp. TaxID=1785 RepID=UPI002B9B5292|nr:hypothetical protein [Mycobacterium sp.]HTY33141.1 hypothetical protein [Mycobacterium sp.]
MGGYYGIEPTGIYSARRGDIVDLDPEFALHEVRNDRVELTLDGPVGKRTIGANVKDRAVLEKEVAAIVARRAAASPPICDCGCGQVLRDPRPHGVVSKLKQRITG